MPQGLVEEQCEIHHTEGSVLRDTAESIKKKRKEKKKEILSTEKCENL